jgi:hypothetical protein
MESADPIFSYVTLERTICFGHCPVYRIKIYSSGMVEWEGIEHVAKKGKAKWYISPEEAKKISEIAEKIIAIFEKYEHLVETGKIERELATDMPSCKIGIKYTNGEFKSISHYLGDLTAPEELETLEEEIDRISGTEKWVGRE